MTIATREANPAAARKAAQDLLNAFSVRGAPVPVEKMIKARGIALQYAPLDEELSGMAFIKDGVGIIGVNALHHPNRQRFTAAHELAHHVLHAPEITEMMHVDRGFRVLHRDQLAAQGTDPLEIDANAFASELLMPRQFLIEAIGDAGIDVDDDAAVQALARRFKVSASAMRNRLSGGWY
ncbi:MULTISPECIES: ImmA/IrrE family metallo-endopeptidase [unclassified Phenylobacterium]|uniref:ImmA/IrrE family metallo-endopeptidase n=1 Tax=unclassified Phenylobacterium TaxID=2640670 RepID=UPI00083A354E|nr:MULTISPECIES: ImmA/IrrE family metallo-endopeptidase [unclassified Phenylobacterium]